MSLRASKKWKIYKIKACKAGKGYGIGEHFDVLVPGTSVRNAYSNLQLEEFQEQIFSYSCLKEEDKKEIRKTPAKYWSPQTKAKVFFPIINDKQTEVLNQIRKMPF